MKPGHPRGLSASQQLLNLRSDPNFPGQGTLRPGGLTWVCELRPTPLSRTYTIRIEYSRGGTPQVFVDHPNLVELAGGPRLPHTYAQSPTKLCLYQPAYREWHDGLLISRTIIQWAMLWLFFFEEWLISGEWKGGGEHPPSKPEKKRRPARDRHRIPVSSGDTRRNSEVNP